MKDRSELRNKIFSGIKAAIEKLIEARAKEDDNLIISQDGKIIKVPAKKFKKG